MNAKQDPYKYPGTNVLRNLPGIKDSDKLANFEYQMATLREIQLIEKPIKGDFDLKHLQGIHRELFKDVYDWAGETRTVGIAKGGSSFIQPTLIEEYANSKVFKSLKDENLLQGLSKEKFVESLSRHFSEINTLHPFREGNGRATRIFVAELSEQAGYSIDFDNVDPDAWTEASRASFTGRMEPIQDIFRDSITSNIELEASNEKIETTAIAAIPKPDRAVAFQTLPMEEALKKHPELSGAYSELKAIAQEIDPQLPQSARQSMYSVAKETIGLQLERGEIPEADEPAPQDEVITHAKIHSHAVQTLERHYAQVRDNPSFRNHDQGELIKVAYFRGVYEKSSESKGQLPDFDAYDAKMANREILRQLPDAPDTVLPEVVKTADRGRSNSDDMSL